MCYLSIALTEIKWTSSFADKQGSFYDESFETIGNGKCVSSPLFEYFSTCLCIYILKVLEDIKLW